MTTVLLIEEDAISRQQITHCLKSSRFQVVATDNGLIGLQIIYELNPDLILCSINLSDLSSYSFLQSIRKDRLVAQIPIVFLTDQFDFHKHKVVLQLGANACLTQPIDSNELLRLTKTLIKEASYVDGLPNCGFSSVNQLLLN